MLQKPVLGCTVDSQHSPAKHCVCLMLVGGALLETCVHTSRTAAAGAVTSFTGGCLGEGSMQGQPSACRYHHHREHWRCSAQRSCCCRVLRLRECAQLYSVQRVDTDEWQAACPDSGQMQQHTTPLNFCCQSSYGGGWRCSGSCTQNKVSWSAANGGSRDERSTIATARERLNTLSLLPGMQAIPERDRGSQVKSWAPTCHNGRQAAAGAAPEHEVINCPHTSGNVCMVAFLSCRLWWTGQMRRGGS